MSDLIRDLYDGGQFNKTPFQVLLQLDRYAIKELDISKAKVGDIIVGIYDDSNPDSPQKDWGKIVNIDYENQLLTFYGEVKAQEHTVPFVKAVLCLDAKWSDAVNRMVMGVMSIDRQYPHNDHDEYEERIRKALYNEEIVPGGRIQAMLGAKEKYGKDLNLTAYNCYALPSPHDSRGGIVKNFGEMVEIMATGGGVGINISTLRPRYAKVNGVNGTSSGAVSWGGLYSYGTGLIEQGGCSAFYEKVLTNKGWITAEDIYNSNEELMAYTHKGFKKIVSKFKNGVKDVFRLTTKEGYTIDVTEDHKINVIKNNGNIELVPLKDIKEGDYVAVLLGDVGITEYVNVKHPAMDNTYIRKEIALPNVLNEDLAFIVGFYHANGSAYKYRVQFTVDKNRTETIEKLSNAFKNVFNLDIVTRIENSRPNTITVEAHSSTLVEFLRINNLLKTSSLDVSVPELIWQSPKSVIEAYIGGCFAGDGCNEGKNGGLSYSTSSKKFAYEYQKLLLYIGIPSTIKIRKYPNKNWQDNYEIKVRGGRFVNKFANILSKYTDKVNDKRIVMENRAWAFPFNIYEKIKHVNGMYKKTSPTNKSTPQLVIEHLYNNYTEETCELDRDYIEMLYNIVPAKVASIELLGPMEVYDFEVEDVHLLSFNGIYTSNSRRGALILQLHVTHPDIFEFITIKRSNDKITNANLSVQITDEFINAVKEDKDWKLIFPDTKHPEYDKSWGSKYLDIHDWLAAGLPVNVYKTVKARNIFNLIMESAWASAEPGFIVYDRMNGPQMPTQDLIKNPNGNGYVINPEALERFNRQKHLPWNNTWYYQKFVTTNPCVTGDTLIMTDKGYVRIDSVVGQKVNVWNGFEFSEVEPRVTGFDQEIYDITFSDGSTLSCTPYHKFILKDGTRVEAQHLRVSDKLAKFDYPVIQTGNSYDDSIMYTQGVYAGDGFVDTNKKSNCIFLYDEKKNLLKYLSYKSVHEYNDKRLLVVLDKLFEWDKTFVPDAKTYNVRARLQWLAGLIDADGSINSEDGAISIWSVDKDFLMRVKYMLHELGCGAVLSLGKNEQKKMMPDGHGGQKEYDCKTSYRLVIRASSVCKLKALGLNTYRVSLIEKVQRDTSRFIQVVSITKRKQKADKVYCFTEPKNHSGMFGCVVTAQCGEIPLPPYGVCNLNHINLSEMYNPITNDVDWAKLKQVIHDAIRLSDDVVDYTPYHIEENRKVQMGQRRIGLGTMGLADLLIDLGIRYGSDECIKFCDKLYSFIKNEAYRASALLAKVRGAFPMYDERILKARIPQSLDEDIKELIRQYGLRNSHLLTQAPTGTTATKSGRHGYSVSTGIEPHVALSWKRVSRMGTTNDYLGKAKDWMDKHPGEKLPDYFVSAMGLEEDGTPQITPLQHVLVQAAIQKHNDSSISKTANVPNNFTVEDVATLYMAGWEHGLVGITIYRDGSRDKQVLYSDTDNKKEQKDEKPIEKKKFYKRPHKLSGETYKTPTPFGKAYVTVNKNDENIIEEIFIKLGKTGADISAIADGLAIAITGMLSPRISQLEPIEKLEWLTKKFKGISGATSIGFGPNKVESLPDALAKVFEEVLGSDNNNNNEENGDDAIVAKNNDNIVSVDVCPQCGKSTFVRQDGCYTCMPDIGGCGYSKCG